MESGTQYVEFGWGEPVEAKVRREKSRNLKNRFWLYLFWTSMVGAVIPPLFGLYLVIIAMEESFAVAGAKGMGEATALSNNLGLALNSTAAGAMLSIPCMVVMIVSIVFLSKTGDDAVYS